MVTKKLKIGFVFDDSLDKPDGVQQYVLTMGRWLSEQGYDVHYLVGETLREDVPNIYSLSRNVAVRFNQNRMAIPLPARLQPIREVLAREQFDILHVQVPYSPALAGRIIVAAGDKTAVVGTFHVAPHSPVVTLGNRALGLWVRRTLKRFDLMMATSGPAAAFAKRTFGVESTVVPLPVRLDGFTGAKPFSRYASGKTVVFLGRLVERKGCQHLLRAVSYAVRRNMWPEHTRIVVCGGGPLEGRLKRFTHEHGLNDIVEFTGYISEEDKPRYLASADVAIYPSTGGESFGIVLLEAMAAVPGMVLAGDNPGYRSVLAPHPESLFDPRNTPLLAEKLVQVLADDTARFEAHAWQKKYVEQFNVPHVGERTVQLYNDALHSREKVLK